MRLGEVNVVIERGVHRVNESLVGEIGFAKWEVGRGRGSLELFREDKDSDDSHGECEGTFEGFCGEEGGSP